MNLTRIGEQVWKRAALAVVSGLAVGGLATGALAEERMLPREPVLPLDLAEKAVRAAVDQCEKDGYRVSAAVVDRGGVLKALLRADGAGPHTTDSSSRKAYTSASMGRPTSEFAELIAKMPKVQALRDMNEKILILGGGLPIRLDNSVVGGIGVGGAPGGHLDEACALAGLKAIGADVSSKGK